MKVVCLHVNRGLAGTNGCGEQVLVRGESLHTSGFKEDDDCHLEIQ